MMIKSLSLGVHEVATEDSVSLEAWRSRIPENLGSSSPGLRAQLGSNAEGWDRTLLLRPEHQHSCSHLWPQDTAHCTPTPWGWFLALWTVLHSPGCGGPRLDWAMLSASLALTPTAVHTPLPETLLWSLCPDTQPSYSLSDPQHRGFWEHRHRLMSPRNIQPEPVFKK